MQLHSSLAFVLASQDIHCAKGKPGRGTGGEQVNKGLYHLFTHNSHRSADSNVIGAGINQNFGHEALVLSLHSMVACTYEHRKSFGVTRNLMMWLLRQDIQAEETTSSNAGP